jgi:hypothetical protein
MEAYYGGPSLLKTHSDGSIWAELSAGLMISRVRKSMQRTHDTLMRIYSNPLFVGNP